jgi:hypothetical protein
MAMETLKNISPGGKNGMSKNLSDYRATRFQKNKMKRA